MIPGQLLQVIHLLMVYATTTTATPSTINSKHIPEDYEIVHPEIHIDGNVVSEWTDRHRLRRDAELQNGDFYINITSSHHTYHIKVHSNSNILAPGFKVYHRHGVASTEHVQTNTSSLDGAESTEHVQTTTSSVDGDCIYKGDIISHSSKTALSLCGGVTGILQLPEEDYVIEPLPEYLTPQSQGPHHYSNHHHRNHHRRKHPHILYKRSAVKSHDIKNYETRDYSQETFNEEYTNRYYNPPRRKRSPEKRYRPDSAKRTIETLVVVDKHVYWKHGKENITMYILSMFNIVSQLFHDDSIGRKVDIVLVGLIILDGEEPGLTIRHHADKTLNSFCQWQSVIGGKRHRQHDHAILLTGLDICAFKDRPCDTLGFAPIKGMCNRIRSCIVVEDSGLSTAFTIAHEIGHNFGMFHDGDTNPCEPSIGTIMSPTLSSKTGMFKWSSCSRNYIERFFNLIQSSCLIDEPQSVSELRFPRKLPGQIFNADTQCKWQFGKHARLCVFDFGKREVCQKLWCYKGGYMCETKFLPAADGTSCGRGMWCKQGKCEKYGISGPRPVDGHWSTWSEWSECSRTCGGGIKHRKRVCNNPMPQYGGRRCEGSKDIHKMCSLQKCPPGSLDFRSVQCAEFNQEPFRGWQYKWRPYQRIFDEQEQCKLYCQADGYNFFYALNKQVKDGTRCNHYSDNVCVQGNCRTVGCDLIIGSGTKRDSCGVCMGDNSTCNRYEGIFEDQPGRNTYFPVVIIPKGSQSIIMKETSISPNYLAVRDIRGKYYLNGDWHLNSEGAYTIGGVRFLYRRSYREPESLESEGPTEEDIVLVVLSQGKNPGISYSYTLPKVPAKPMVPKYNYTWSVKLTHCSQPCAGGEQRSSAHCYRSDGEEVDPRLCVRASMPKTGVTPCNIQPCLPRWDTGAWSKCSQKCGGGYQKRKLYCRQKITTTKERRVSKRRCLAHLKPKRKIPCNTQECPPMWRTGKWSQCSVTCGKGTKTRQISCHSMTINGLVDLASSMCQHETSPPRVKRCFSGRCPVEVKYQWVVSSWSQCSSSCGRGVRSRVLRCGRQDKPGKLTMVAISKCNNLPQPSIAMTDNCQLEKCEEENKPYWHLSPWSECSVSCGNGIQTRLVHCIDEVTQDLSVGCSNSIKPVSRKQCNDDPCPTPDPLCADVFQWCYLVPKHNICGHHFYGKKCCRSCQGR